MSEVLTNGIKVPDKGSRSWYDDMRGDLVKLDALIGSASSSVTVNPIITSGIEIASITVNGTAYSLYQQDGDIAVNIKPVTTNAELPILLSKSSEEENTDSVDMSVGVTVNPGSNTVTASSFVGALTGNAETATKATQDGSGNVIADTYATKNELSGKANDADVVHLANTESITGIKYFTEDIYNKNENTVVTETPTTNQYLRYRFIDKNNDQLASIQYANRTSGTRDLGFYLNTADDKTLGVTLDTNKDFSPIENNTYSLGTASANWKSAYINSVNSANITLSDPDFLRCTHGNYGSFWRQDGSDLYLMLTNLGDNNGTWNSYRPIVVNLPTGKCYINGVDPNDMVLAFCVIALNKGNLVAGTALNVANGTGGAFAATAETLIGTYRALNTVAANGVGMFIKIA